MNALLQNKAIFRWVARVGDVEPHFVYSIELPSISKDGVSPLHVVFYNTRGSTINKDLKDAIEKRETWECSIMFICGDGSVDEAWNMTVQPVFMKPRTLTYDETVCVGAPGALTDVEFEVTNIDVSCTPRDHINST